MLIDAHTRSRTLEELDGEVWEEPDFTSHLVWECHRLRRVPLQEFRPEDLRIMIGQGIGLSFLVPLALERLLVEPWVSGDFYEGDLLEAVLSVSPSFWCENPAPGAAARRVAMRAMDEYDRCGPKDTERYDERVVKVIQRWLQV